MELEIINAKYYVINNNKVKDVLDIIKKKLIDNTINITVNNELFGEPCIGFEKLLMLKYRYKTPSPDNKYIIKYVKENTNLYIYPVNTLTIISAKYGYSDNTTVVEKDVKDIINNQINDNSLDILVNNALFGDPYQGFIKRLNIQYKLNDIMVIDNNILEADSLIINKQLKTYIYFHICCLENWKEVTENIIATIKNSGLFTIVSEIRCFILGNMGTIPTFLKDEKIKIIKTSNELGLYERFTLSHLWNDCQKENFNVLYLHSKGITHKSNNNIKDWVNYLLYFTCYKYLEILGLLEIYHTVGVNLLHIKKRHFHYSGNFWWATSWYLKTLPNTIGPNYLDPEFWILKNKQVKKHVCLWNSRIGHYKTPYTKDNYFEKEINLNII